MGEGFDKHTFSDLGGTPDARLVTIDGRKVIFARSQGAGPGLNVIYTWSGSTLEVDTSLENLGGKSVLAGPFTGNSDNWLIIGSSRGETGEGDIGSLGIPVTSRQVV